MNKITTQYGNGDSPIKNIFRAAFPIILYLALCTAVLILGASLSSFIMLRNGITEISEDMIQSLTIPCAGVSSIISIPIFLWMYNRITLRQINIKFAQIANVSTAEAVKLREAHEPDPKNIPAIDYIWAVIAGVCLACSINIILNLIGSGESGVQYNSTIGTIFDLPVYLQILISGVTVPIAEELVFRGCTYRYLREWLQMVPSVIIGALAFGIYHWNLVQGLYAFIMGIVLCLCMEKYVRILAAIICHVCANLIMILVQNTELMNIFVSGNVLIGAFVSAVTLVAGIYAVMRILKLEA